MIDLLPTMVQLLEQQGARTGHVQNLAYKEIYVDPTLAEPGHVDGIPRDSIFTADVRSALEQLLPAGTIKDVLGQGSYGVVWDFVPDHGPRMALKISEDEPDAYKLVARAKGTSKPGTARHLPKIYAAWLIPESGRPSAAWLIPDSGLVITLMEYLEPLPIKMEKLLRKAIITGKLPDYSLTSNVDAATAEFIGVATFYHAMEDLIDFQNIEPDDLHHGNIMVRPTDKSLVVSDIGLFR